MQITVSAISLDVDDVAASSLTTSRSGSSSPPATSPRSSGRTPDSLPGHRGVAQDQRHDRAAGLILAFTVADLEGELARLQNEGAAAHRRQWGERSFQVRDPNGVIIQLLDWNAGP